MIKVSNDELNKIAGFISSCNDMINGKFILADVKILKILNQIAKSDALYKTIAECLIGFNFDKELHRAEVKNKFNGGEFNLPEDRKMQVAMAFSLLVEFNNKNIDFYQFIKENFSTLSPGGEYANFANKVLVPFRDYIAEIFGLSTIVTGDEITQFPTEEVDLVSEEEIVEDFTPEPTKEEILFEKIEKSLNDMIATLQNDFKLKSIVKEDLLYILTSAKYSLKYKDLKLVTALLTSFDIISKKAHSIKFLYQDLKRVIVEYFENR